MSGPGTVKNVIVWWEVRRLPVNLVAFGCVAICLPLMAWGQVRTSNFDPPYNLIQLAIPFVTWQLVLTNVLHLLGWLLEVGIRFAKEDVSLELGPRLLRWLLCIGLTPASILALFWVAVGLIHPEP